MSNIISSELKIKASQGVLDSVQEDLEKEQRRSIGSLLNEQEEHSKTEESNN